MLSEVLRLALDMQKIWGHPGLYSKIVSQKHQNMVVCVQVPSASSPTQAGEPCALSAGNWIQAVYKSSQLS